MSDDLLTDAQHEAIKGWIARVRGYFALDGWNLELSHEATPTEDAMASTFVYDKRDRATIYLSKDWLDADEFSRRVLLAHELLHPTFYRIVGLAERLVAREMGNTAERVFNEAIDLAQEQAVDRLAAGLAPLLPPLPELPT